MRATAETWLSMPVQFRSVDAMFAYRLNPLVDGETVVAGGDDEVGRRNGALGIDFVAANEGAARRFDHADTLGRIYTCGGADVVSRI